MTESAAASTLSAQDGSLLLYCLGIRRERSRIASPPSLTTSDSVDILRQARENGITPLLYDRLTTVVPAPQLPPAAIDQLREAAVRSAVHSLEISRELADVLGILRRHGIAVIVLKGAHLGHLVYRSAALRTMGDLDIMVRRDQLATAESLLGQLGYAPIHDPLVQIDYTQHHHTEPLAKPGAVRIELHWTIARTTSTFAVDLEGVWQRAVPARIAGVEALVLAAEDLLLHLCLHASFDHQFRLGLRACWDIREVVQRQATIDWTELVRRAQSWGIGRYVYVTLRLVRDLLDVAVPAAPLATLEPPGFSPEVIGWARRCIFAPETSVSPSMAKLWTSRRLRTRFTLLLQTLFLSRAAMARIYRVSARSGRIYLYYPVRWADLLQRYGRHAWGLWRGDHRTHDELRAESERAALKEWLSGAAT